MRKHFSSLRSQMTLLTTGTVLAVVILATVFYSSAQRMSEKKSGDVCAFDARAAGRQP